MFLLGRVVLDVILIGTGEAVLWALTFGRRKPRWNLYVNERAADALFLAIPSIVSVRAAYGSGDPILSEPAA